MYYFEYGSTYGAAEG